MLFMGLPALPSLLRSNLLVSACRSQAQASSSLMAKREGPRFWGE